MTRLVRYTLNSQLPVTITDRHADVLRGTFEEFEAAGAQARLLPPTCPSKIVCVGRNYADHAKELGNEVPTEPLIFLKPPSSLNAHGAPIVYPVLTSNLHFEGELGLVIGSRLARSATPQQAAQAVGWLTVVNDVTARDLQKKDGQWTRGKGFDTFCPVGPWMTPVSEIDLRTLRVITRVNGAVRQDAPLSDMLFDAGVILHFVSQFMTLEPGDLIATGTPPGVGPMVAGDRVEVEVPGLGRLENPVVAA
jgi:2-keto-4-pentenoate hydratase/2-oxohepta-3-ene-1,7-dioic acid hydratase in catechol pathway